MKACPGARLEGACSHQASASRAGAGAAEGPGVRWGTGTQPLARLLGAAWSCCCPKVPTLSLGISASSAEPTPELPHCKPTGPALALGSASLTAELLQHARGLSPWIQRGALISSSHCSPWIQHGEPSSPAASWSRPLGKGSLVCDSEIHQCLFHSW